MSLSLQPYTAVIPASNVLYMINNETLERFLNPSVLSSTRYSIIEEVLISPIKKWAGAVIGLRFGDMIYSLLMGFGPMLSSNIGRVPMGHRGCLYFGRTVSEPMITSLSYNEWRVYLIKYEATAGRDDVCK